MALNIDAKRPSKKAIPFKSIDTILDEAADGHLAQARNELQQRIDRINIQDQSYEYCHTLIALGLILIDMDCIKMPVHIGRCLCAFKSRITPRPIGMESSAQSKNGS